MHKFFDVKDIKPEQIKVEQHGHDVTVRGRQELDERLSGGVLERSVCYSAFGKFRAWYG